MIQELESLIRAGKLREASARLRKLNVAKVQRKDALAFANLAARSGQAKLSVKILNRFIRGKNTDAPPTPEELIQYANSLNKLGANPEALEILRTIDSRKNPEALLNLAFCHAYRWQYAEMIEMLKAYLQNDNVPPYRRSVAKVNLIAALIHENADEEARRMIAELQDELRRSESVLLLGSLFELQAQLEIHCRNWDHAISALEQARALLAGASNHGLALFIEKWHAVAESMKAGVATPSLFRAKTMAVSRGEWEAVRDCDYFIALLRRDEKKLHHLYFGTPYPSYRSRILKALELTSPPAGTYLWMGEEAGAGTGAEAGTESGSGSEAGTESESESGSGSGSGFQTEAEAAVKIFDLFKGETDDRRVHLEVGQNLHRLLIILSQDFYKPVPAVALFSRLFPGEYFNPVSSPNRVHQALKRLRDFFAGNQLPLEIKAEGGHYRLKFLGGLALRMPSQPLPLDSRELELLYLKTTLPQSFTAREAANCLGISRSGMGKILQRAVKDGKLTLEGATKNARYTFAA